MCNIWVPTWWSSSWLVRNSADVQRDTKLRIDWSFVCLFLEPTSYIPRMFVCSYIKFFFLFTRKGEDWHGWNSVSDASMGPIWYHKQTLECKPMKQNKPTEPVHIQWLSFCPQPSLHFLLSRPQNDWSAEYWAPLTMSSTKLWHTKLPN